MNAELQKLARSQIIEGLSQLGEKEQRFFVRIFHNKNRDLSIEDAVQKLPENKIDGAMSLVQRTLDK